MTKIDLVIQTFMDWSFEEQFSYIFFDSDGIGFKHPQVCAWSDFDNSCNYELYSVDGFYVTVKKDMDYGQVESFTCSNGYQLN